MEAKPPANACRDSNPALLAQTFGPAQAQKLADSQRRDRYGDCGACILKERVGDAWIFKTVTGYAGAIIEPDIMVFSPQSSFVPVSLDLTSGVRVPNDGPLPASQVGRGRHQSQPRKSDGH